MHKLKADNVSFVLIHSVWLLFVIFAIVSAVGGAFILTLLH